MPNTKPIPTERDPVRAALADELEGLSQLLTKENTGSDAGFDDICWRAAQELRRHLPGRLDCGAIDREQIAALLYVTRYPWRTWFMASLDETALAYKQADQIIAALPRAVDGGAAGEREAAIHDALLGLIEAVELDSDTGGKGISGYTAARLHDARETLSAFPRSEG